MSTVLFVVTGARTWTLNDGTSHPTGFWAEELTTPYRLLTEAGHTVTIATPGGVLPVADAGSLDAEQAAAVAGIPQLGSPVDLAAVSASDFDAIYYPGGHGPMEDLSTDATSAALITAALATDQPLGLVCHGLAALLPARTVHGVPVVSGRRITGFTDAEEKLGGLADKASWLLESRLREQGAQFSGAEPWQDHVVVDGNLVTGQNPRSSASAAKALLELLA